jgi:hypothetical protein
LQGRVTGDLPFGETGYVRSAGRSKNVVYQATEVSMSTTETTALTRLGCPDPTHCHPLTSGKVSAAFL